MVRKNLKGFTNSYADVIKLNQSDPKTFFLEGILLLLVSFELRKCISFRKTDARKKLSNRLSCYENQQ